MSLIGEERKKLILERLNLNGKIHTLTLADEFNVSTETIRKYLDELENQNKLKKVYGGAIKISSYKDELPFILRDISNLSEKQLLALEASKLIEDNDVIILDEGSTVFKLLEFIIHKKNLTIVTPSLPTLSFLVDMENKKMFNGKIIFIGGVVNCMHGRTSGSIAEDFISKLYVKKAFISTEGISLDGGITDFESEKALLSKKFIEHSQSKYILCDHTKLGKRSFYKICDFSDITGIVCDKKPSQKWIECVQKYKVEWISPS